MAVTYSVTAINARLNGVITACGSAAQLLIRSGNTVLSTVLLASPVGTVDAGVLTFIGNITDIADATGNADNIVIRTSSGATILSDLSVGIPLSGADVIISNGSNTTLISAGLSVNFLSGEITGS